MGIRFGIAQATGVVLEWTLKHVFHRPAANFPGKAGLYIDPQLIGDLRSRLHEGAVVVVGTNGKTTVTNLLADAFIEAGKTVACNWTGANLDSGVASALLQADVADWGVLECDELWLAKVVPQLKPRYVVLLNLFRDQLDRMGEIEHIQDSIAQALGTSPSTALVYNCDDPLCQAIADLIDNECIPFGIGEDLGLVQNTVADTSMCQQCGHMLDYRWRQYGQLGAYCCPQCGFTRSEPAYCARDVRLSSDGADLTAHGEHSDLSVHSHLAGAYMVYNLMAVCAAADLCDVSSEAVNSAIQTFAPDNGRLQRYEVDGCRILLNLAKNPTGLNQNLRIVLQEPGSAAVAFFINDKEADGHDVSWLWDVDFQELAERSDVKVFAGGMRRNDLQVRLKYAGIDAALVDSASDFIAQAHALAPDAGLYLIANYTALPPVKAELDHMERLPQVRASNGLEEVADSESSMDSTRSIAVPAVSAERLVIVHLYPELLNLYGDSGNVTVLAERARKRGIDVSVVRMELGQKADFDAADIVFLGGGPDRQQRLAAQDLLLQAGELRAYAKDDGVMLAICGGFQLLGRTWVLGDEDVPGLGILDVETRRVEGGSHNRLVGNIVLESPLASLPVVGYENHAGRTFLDAGSKPFGGVMGRHGYGNNDIHGVDGAIKRNVVGTYLHGPLLAKNPEIADYLIERALERRAKKEGRNAPELPSLDDRVEHAANAFMCDKLGIRSIPAHSSLVGQR